MGSDLTHLAIDDQGWRTFAAAHPDASPFHRPEWAKLLAECYGFRSQVLVLRDGDGEIAAGLPILEVGRHNRKRWVALPFTDRCGSIATGQEAAVRLAGCLDAIREQLGLRSIEVRDGLPGARWVREEGHWHELELSDDPGAVFAGFHKSRVRSSLKRAEREGITVALGRSQRDLCEVFYGLHVATRRRLGVPVQPRRFFDLLWERLLVQGHGFVALASRGGAAIAGAVFLASRGRLTYKFSAMDRRFGALGAGNAVLWSGIQQGCRDGARRFDFGRTEPGNEGLRAFKLGWGATETPLRYSFYAPTPPAPSVTVNPRLRSVIRQSPPWVARAIGTAAYRFTA